MYSIYAYSMDLSLRDNLAHKILVLNTDIRREYIAMAAEKLTLYDAN